MLDNVHTNGLWEAKLEAITVNGVKLAGFRGRTGVMDTAAQAIFMSKNDAAAIHVKIPGAKIDDEGFFTVPCLSTTRLEFTFKDKLTYQDTTFAIDPRDLVHFPLDPNDPSGDCHSAIYGHDTHSQLGVRVW
jgi:cathepsin D